MKCLRCNKEYEGDKASVYCCAECFNKSQKDLRRNEIKVIKKTKTTLWILEKGIKKKYKLDNSKKVKKCKEVLKW